MCFVFSCVSWRLGRCVVSVRVAVIGVGHLGRHHARILSALAGVELVAVVDTNRARAEEIARANGTEAAFDARDVLAQGVIAAVKELGVRVPIVIRMEGTNVEEGKRLLKESRMNFTTADSMDEAARRVVQLAG